jgi:uncharacterized membrane protein YdbT with pleckstrin-like domain
LRRGRDFGPVLRLGVTSAEETLWEGKPALKLLAAELLTTLLFAIAVSIAVALAYRPTLTLLRAMPALAGRRVSDYEPGLRLAATLFVVVVVGQRFVRLAQRGVVLRSNDYRLTNQRLVLESGVLSRALTEIDLRTVDEVSFRQSFGERLLGLGEIAVATSELGAQAPRRTIRLLGVSDPRAVRESIRNAAYAATRQQVFVRGT